MASSSMARARQADIEGHDVALRHDLLRSPGGGLLEGVAVGHLGDEGTVALLAIMANTYNYRRELTARHLERLPPWPISCPKIRELHPGAMDSGSCKCHFALRGKGYPTPLLFALRPSEVPVFRRQSPKPKSAQATTPAAPAASAVGDAQGVEREAEEKVRKLAELKRHRRGIDASIERLRQELAALLERAETDTLQAFDRSPEAGQANGRRGMGLRDRGMKR